MKKLVLLGVVGLLAMTGRASAVIGTIDAVPAATLLLPYFEVDTTHDLWRQLNNSGGLAMHVSGEFPELQLEFWAIRR